MISSARVNKQSLPVNYAMSFRWSFTHSSITCACSLSMTNLTMNTFAASLMMHCHEQEWRVTSCLIRSVMAMNSGTQGKSFPLMGRNMVIFPSHAQGEYPKFRIYLCVNEFTQHVL